MGIGGLNSESDDKVMEKDEPQENERIFLYDSSGTKPITLCYLTTVERKSSAFDIEGSLKQPIYLFFSTKRQQSQGLD